MQILDTTLGAYEIIGLMLLTALVMLPIVLSLWSVFHLIRARLARKRPSRRLLIVTLAIDVVMLVCAVDAWFVEPNRLSVTRIEADSAKVSPSMGTLKLALVSDLHFEHDRPLYARLLRTIESEKPDLLLVTGDIAQIGDCYQAQFHRFLTRLASVAPSCFVCGYDDVGAILRASDRKLFPVDREPFHMVIRGMPIDILSERQLERGGEGAAQGPLRIILNHTPDLIESAARHGADLYFGGHTHGGQVRIPGWGAIVTNTGTGKRFEYGRYRVGEMTAFVTRGVGLEASPAPQVRFLCPPELVIVTVDSSRR